MRWRRSTSTTISTVATGLAVLCLQLGLAWMALLLVADVARDRIGDVLVVGELGDGQPARTGRGPQLSNLAVGVAAQGCGATVGGSGFVVDGLVVTSYHVVAGAERLTVEVAGREVEAVLASISPGLDLAVLRPSAPLGRPGGELADADAVAGGDVVMVGVVGGRPVARAARIEVSGPGHSYGVDGQVLLLDPPPTPGLSGGAVLDAEGRVVGIVRGYDEVTSLGIAPAVSELRRLLDSPTVDVDQRC